MLENYDNFDGFECDSDRAAPHFNDRSVIKQARRVVPLSETNRKKNKSRLFLTGAFATAMLLGAAVALVAARLERQRFQAAALEISKVETTNAGSLAQASTEAGTEKLEEISQPVASPETDVPLAASQPVNNGVEAELGAPESSSKASSGPAGKPAHTPAPEQLHHDETLAKDSVDPIKDLPNDDQIAQPPAMVDEWQERRLRRIEKFDRRARRAAQGRDLMRIDEIFEGTRRP